MRKILKAFLLMLVICSQMKAYFPNANIVLIEAQEDRIIKNLKSFIDYQYKSGTGKLHGKTIYIDYIDLKQIKEQPLVNNDSIAFNDYTKHLQVRLELVPKDKPLLMILALDIKNQFMPNVSIPAALFRILKDHNITELMLFSNIISTIKNGLPETFELLKNLKKIYASREFSMKTLPESFGKLTKLEYLSLHPNDLKTLPKSFGDLNKLKYLNLSQNKLTSLHDSFGNLTKLEVLKLWSNKLSALPDSFGNLKELKELELQSNKLKDLPQSFENLIKLETLRLNENYFASTPNSLNELKIKRGNDLNIAGLDDQRRRLVGMNIFQRIKGFFTRNA